ncbi:hypothetical protein QA601_02555 [Chitinispirillales bacterium ANBcel5]|uniref:GH39 family glycosyl hydrolase n=1 Tax=Cellulosispirillum alkaliphilum TaxID=3039283 RepID=UPI002A4E71F0|nr:hypothetical protein [Chitinispirillales bacterium ANBcel5]
MFKYLLILTLMISCATRYEIVEEKRTPESVTIDGRSVINTLSDYFFGHNYWMWAPTWGNQIMGTESLISDLNLSLLRFGGIQVDLGHPDSVTEARIAQYIEYCEAVGAKPVIQMQIARYTTTEERVENAVKMFNYFRTLYPVRYVAIGNEPDLYFDNLATNPEYNAQYLRDYTIDDYIRDFNAVASELKSIDPDIKIIGLDLSHRYDQWIPPFVAECRDNVDIISVHYYPFHAAQCTYNVVHDHAPAINTFYSDIRTLIDQNAGDREIPLMIGETNISWDGDPANSTRDASPGTFNAALWFADYVGVSSAQDNLLSIMPWSISEGWTLGFIDASRRVKPVYYVYKMFSNHTKEHLIHSENVNQYLRVYAFKDDLGGVSVFLINWDRNASYDLDLSFTDVLDDSSVTHVVPPHSVSVINLSSGLEHTEIIEYRSDNKEDGPVLNP